MHRLPQDCENNDESKRGEEEEKKNDVPALIKGEERYASFYTKDEQTELLRLFRKICGGF